MKSKCEESKLELTADLIITLFVITILLKLYKYYTTKTRVRSLERVNIKPILSPGSPGRFPVKVWEPGWWKTLSNPSLSSAW